MYAPYWCDRPREVNLKNTLNEGIKYQHIFKITKEKTVPNLYPESDLFRAMPGVLATGYMVGLLEWACIELLRNHLDWPAEQTLGTHVNFSHLAPTLPGMTVTVDVELIKIDGRRLVFKVEANDGVASISAGLHERFIINRDQFLKKLEVIRAQAEL